MTHKYIDPNDSSSTDIPRRSYTMSEEDKEPVPVTPSLWSVFCCTSRNEGIKHTESQDDTMSHDALYSIRTERDTLFPS